MVHQSGSSAVRHVDSRGQEYPLAGVLTYRRGEEVWRGAQQHGPAVFASECAGENVPAFRLDNLVDDLAIRGYAHAALAEWIGHPHMAFGIHRTAVGN